MKTLTQITIAFSAPVVSADLHAQSVMILIAEVGNSDSNPAGAMCWCQVPVTFAPINLTTACDISDGGTPATGTTCNAVRVNMTSTADQLIRALELSKNSTVRVQVHGDLIRDNRNPPLALDGNHLPPWLQTPPPAGGQKTGDGVAGGVFESWFTVNL